MPEKSIYEQLLSAASSNADFTPKKNSESDQEFFNRLAGTIGGIADEYWSALSAGAQQWYDFALDEDNNLKSVIDAPDGYVVEVAPVAAPRRRPATKPVVMTTVYEDLVAFAKQCSPEFAPKHSKESDQDYLARVVRDLDPTVPVPGSIADWLFTADEALEKSEKIPLPPGFEPTVVKKPTRTVAPKEAKANGKADVIQHTLFEPETLPEVRQGPSAIEVYNSKLLSGETGKQRRKPSVPDAPKATNGTKSSEPRAPTPRGPRPFRADSNTAMIRRAVTLNPKITTPELVEMLRSCGKECSVATINTTKASHVAAMRDLIGMGMPPPETWQAPN